MYVCTVCVIYSMYISFYILKKVKEQYEIIYGRGHGSCSIHIILLIYLF